jgi:hypothetical protein
MAGLDLPERFDHLVDVKTCLDVARVLGLDFQPKSFSDLVKYLSEINVKYQILIDALSPTYPQIGSLLEKPLVREEVIFFECIRLQDRSMYPYSYQQLLDGSKGKNVLLKYYPEPYTLDTPISEVDPVVYQKWLSHLWSKFHSYNQMFARQRFLNPVVTIRDILNILCRLQHMTLCKNIGAMVQEDVIFMIIIHSDDCDDDDVLFRFSDAFWIKIYPSRTQGTISPLLKLVYDLRDTHLRTGMSLSDFINCAATLGVPDLSRKISRSVSQEIWSYRIIVRGGESRAIPLAASSGPPATTTAECCICLDGPKDYAIVPCGHLCLCGICRTKKIDRCPMCQKQIEGMLRIFS